MIFFCRSNIKPEEDIECLIVGAHNTLPVIQECSIQLIQGNNEFDSITFGDNGKGKVKELGKIVISNDLSISNVLLVESLNFNLLSVA